MPRLRLTLAYEGTDFAGWQIQAHARTRQPRTVQSVLEEALRRICQETVRVYGASRTDAGVHAVGQVAHADVPERAASIDWQKALNAVLPRDVAVTCAEWAPAGFHARISARAKTYSYSLWLTRRYVLPMRRRFVWVTGPLDVAAMDRAAALLTGTRDFVCFQNQGTPVASTVRTLSGIVRRPAALDGETLELVWLFTGDGFLKQMVRNLVGCLVAVGRGKLAPEDIPALMESGDRSLAPATAPPQGLTLERVFY